jgi:uncharacterized protein YpmB
MQTNKITIYFLIVLLAVIVVGTFYYLSKKAPKNTMNYQATQSSTQATISPTPQSAMLQGGNSDQQLQNDNQTLNTQVNSIDSQMSNVDQGLNDQPTNLQ